MDGEREPATEATDDQGNLLVLALLAPFVGAVAGFIGLIFRLALKQADSLRDTLIASAHGAAFSGFLFIITLCAAAPAVVAWLVRRYSPHASGSGIPHVELVLNGELPQAPYRLIPVKFFGGLLAIGSGLALGPEGPSVQMGASLANLLGKLFHRNEEDCKAFLAAGAGAGLPRHLTPPLLAPFSCWRNWRGGLTRGSRLRPSARPQALSPWHTMVPRTGRAFDFAFLLQNL